MNKFKYFVDTSKESDSYFHKYQKYKKKYLKLKYSNIYNHPDSTEFNKDVIKNKKANIFNKMLNWFENFSTKYQINYSIAYGTLLGQIRTQDYIPYDMDVDIFIGKDDVYRLFELYNKSKENGIDHIMVNSKLKENNKIVSQDKITVLLTSEHENMIEDKYRQRWNCKGNQLEMDRCSFNGPVARVIHNNEHCDIFVWSDKKPEKEGYAEDCKEGTNKKYNNYYCSYIASQYGSNLPETKKCKLNNIITRRFVDEELIKDFMIKEYGENYLEPNHKFLNNRLVKL